MPIEFNSKKTAMKYFVMQPIDYNKSKLQRYMITHIIQNK